MIQYPFILFLLLMICFKHVKDDFEKDYLHTVCNTVCNTYSVSPLAAKIPVVTKIITIHIPLESSL